MDCRRSRLAFALPACLAVVPVFAAQTPVTIEVHGGDFPTLVQDTGVVPALDEHGLPRAPGCEAVRARRVDEMPYPWRDAIDRIHLDCQALESAEDGVDTLALNATAYLKPGRVWLAGQAVTEIRLMDSELWGDHQYVLAIPFEQVAGDLRRHVEADCAQRHLREEREAAAECRMHASDGELYLELNEISGLWIHADPDDATRTIYAEAWAD